MKRLKFLVSFVLLFALGFTATAQDYNTERLNLPGDNLNLFAVMKLFQESETLEAFERNLNAENSKINNLDLNEDNKIDYIRVIDYPDGNDHTIVLQVAVNARENQDVAVFTVQRNGSNNVQVQLIGDEALYGRDYIIEPNYADNGSAAETPNPGYTGNTQIVRGENVVVHRTTYVEVSTWPLIRYMFLPSYVVWHSPWYWGYYPSYWNPWRPYYWDYYYGYHSHWNNYYYGYYRPWHTYRYAHWNDHYYNTHRSYSNTVYEHRKSGAYKSTYSRPDTRQQGSADYLKRYPDNRNRSNTRSDANRDLNRQDSRKNVNQSPARGSNNKPAVRQGNDRNVKSRDVNKKETRPSENRSAPRPAVNTRSEKPRKNTPDMRSNTKRSEPRQASPNRSSETKRSATKRSETKRSEPSRSGSKRSESKRTERSSETKPNRR